MNRILEEFLILHAPLAAGLYGLLLGWLLTRSRMVAIAFATAFCMTHVWVWFAMIPTQGVGDYLRWMYVIFVPSPLIAGTLAGGILAYWRRGIGLEVGRRPSVLLPIAGGVAFGGAALLCTAVAVSLQAREPMSTAAPFAIAFYGTFLLGSGLFLLILTMERMGERASG